MKLSIRKVLIGGCILLVWGTHMITTPTSFFSTEKVLVKHAQDIMANISDLSMEQAFNHLSMAQSATYLTERLLRKEVVGSQQENIAKLEHYFLDQLSIYSHFAGIYLGKPDGSFFYVSRHNKHVPDGFRTKVISYENGERTTNYTWRNRQHLEILQEPDLSDKYDPRQRPWYQKVMQEQKVVWTNPYIFFSSKKPGITIAGPVYSDQKKLKGIVGVDIELEELSLFLSKLRIGKSGRAFMLNRNGDVVAFPDLNMLKYKPEGEHDVIRLPKITEIEDPLAKKASETILGKQSILEGFKLQEKAFGKFTYEDKNYLTMFTPFSAHEWPWVIGVYVPEDDYLGSLIDNQYLELVIAILFSFLATIPAVFLARSISKPISKLEKSAKEFKNQNFDARVEVQSHYVELKATADAFNGMKDSILNYREVLRHKEQIHRVITSSVSDGIIMQDHNGKITFWNPEAEILYGYTEEEAVGRNLYELAVAASTKCEKQEENLKIVKQLHKYDEKQRQLEMLVCNRDKTISTVEVSRALIKMEGRDYTISLIRDVTARKKAESEKEIMENKLQRSQKMEAIGLMAGGVAHDLNNILAGVVGYPELLSHMVSDKEVLDGLKIIESSGKKAAAVVSDLLTVARGAVSQKNVCKVNKLISSYLESPEANKLKKHYPGVEIDVDLDSEIDNISGSFIHIEKVIMNLVSNAVEAIDGIGTVVIKSRNVELDEKFTEKYETIDPGNYVEVEVADNGPGIAQKDLERIFEPFYTKKVMGRSGTGLGLSVVWNTMSDHNGTIVVESDGEGTSFKLYFPATKEKILEDLNKEDLEGMKGNASILVIDDAAPQRVITRKMLQQLGYSVQTVSTGEEAIDILSLKSFDLLIIDMLLGGGINGYETFKRSLEIKSDQKAVIISGFAENEEVIATRELGAGDYVKKPFTLEQIGKAVFRVLKEG